jgi:dihydroneopterin aldolase
LIERLGADVLDAMLADPRVQRASVRIAKPALLAGATPAVTLHAARA